MGNVLMPDIQRPGDFAQVDNALKTQDCDVGAAECHGMLCGMLCANSNFQVGNWLEHTLGYQDQEQLHELASSPAISKLFKQTLAGIDAEDFSFSLLLPDDDEPLADRVAALGAWCRGFLSGFGVSDNATQHTLSNEIQDYLRDLQEIGKVDPQTHEGEANEEALFELQEYARMGTLMVHEELSAGERAGASLGTEPPSSSIH